MHECISYSPVTTTKTDMSIYSITYSVIKATSETINSTGSLNLKVDD